MSTDETIYTFSQPEEDIVEVVLVLPGSADMSSGEVKKTLEIKLSRKNLRVSFQSDELMDVELLKNVVVDNLTWELEKKTEGWRVSMEFEKAEPLSHFNWVRLEALSSD